LESAVVSLVPSFNTKRIYGTWVRQGGTEMRPGTYKVTVPVRITNATDDVIIPAGAFVTGSLNVTPGLPSLDILGPCTNDPDNFPSDGWQLQIEIIFADAPGEKYLLDVDIDGPEINLRSVVLVQYLPTPQPVLFRGVAGGVAALDADGDVVDADGVKVVGGPGGTGVDEAAVIEILDDNPPTADVVVETSTHKVLTAAERTKLSGLPSDAQSASQVDSRADARISAFVGAAPGTLNTLDELAAALGDDANFAASTATALGGKVTKTGNETVAGIKTFTSPPVVPAASFPTSAVNGLVSRLAIGLMVLVWDGDWPDRPDTDPDNHYVWFDPAGTHGIPSDYIEGSDMLFQPDVV
jgi:hypothetical protein